MTITALPTPPLRSDPTSFASRGDAFLAALPTFQAEANALAVAMNLNATTDTSASSVLIGTGSKTFTVTAGKSFQPGMYLIIADTAAPSTNSMFGQVTSYSTTSLVMNIISVKGSGTKTAWVISQASAGGAMAGVNADITDLTVLASVNGGQIAGLKNKIINGNFGINQRGVSGTVTLVAGAYGHDRWKAGAGGCTYTFATSLNVTTITITAGTLQQVIEGLNLESGAFNLSWAGTATGRVDAGSYGASGVVGTAVGGTNQTVEFGTGTLSKVMYEFGSATSLFEQRPYGLELALCQRYYCAVPMSGVATSATAMNMSQTWPVPMRVNPTCVIIGGGLFRSTNSGVITQISNAPTYGTSAYGLQFVAALSWTTPLAIGSGYDCTGQSTLLSSTAEL